ncbi:MAG: aldehyde dehydrogenase family protein [Acidobacteriota bacterium]
MSTTSTPTDILVSRDPHDDSVVGEIRVSTSEEVTAAVASAQAAYPAWSALSFDERADALRSAVPALKEAAEELGSLVHREMGKPIKDATGEAKGVAGFVEHAIELSRKAIEPETFTQGNVETTLRRDPLGVVGVITPWNFPLYMPATLIYPALLTGNTVVHKPSERTPLTGQRYTEILRDALPEGVCVPLAGAGEVGKQLVEEPVQMVAFVGSQGAGRHIMSACSKSLKRLILELGGKDPMIVLKDADVEAAAKFAARGAFRNSGQVCVAVERILVEEPIAAELTEKIVALANETEIGPMVDAAHRSGVAAQVDDARAKGASILVGGELPDGPGAHYPPTVISDIDDTMDIASVETFGPVASIRTVSDADEALRLANEGNYGLGATVWTSDREQGEALAAQIQAGMVGINRGIGGVGDSPWVGARQSGFGQNGSVEGTRSFTQVRTITRELPE